jgi:hypothetical protein
VLTRSRLIIGLLTAISSPSSTAVAAMTVQAGVTTVK